MITQIFKNNSKNKLPFLYTLFLLFVLMFQTQSFATSQEYTQNTFSFITQENRNTIISTNRDEVEFTFILKNTLNEVQDFNISINPSTSWEINPSNFIISLNPLEQREISFKVFIPDNLGYTRIVDSQGLSKFVLDDDYFGVFNFPIFVDPLTNTDTLEVVYRLEVYAPMNLPVDFIIEPSTNRMSPEFDNTLRILAQNLDESGSSITTSISKSIGGVELESQDISFSYIRDIIDVSFQIPSTIEPGVYQRIVRVSLEGDGGRSQQWQLRDSVEILQFEQLKVTEEENTNLWAVSHNVLIENIGNTNSKYEVSKNFAWYERIFLSSNVDYSIINSEHVFSVEVLPGEEKNIQISIRYGIILLLLLIILVIVLIKVYLAYKNPLDIDIKFESIKKVKHEGIKSFKVKIGFENIRKEEIDTLRIIFKMPSYLHVKDESFSITPPTKVLKGSNKYKLMWEFKRFEKGDARILGFELVNSKGILGDIHFEDLEFEVISKNNKAKYYTPIETIRG